MLVTQIAGKGRRALQPKVIISGKIIACENKDGLTVATVATPTGEMFTVRLDIAQLDISASRTKA